MISYMISLPTHIVIGNKRVKNSKGIKEIKPNNFSLNLNTYRNAHYQQLNKSKIMFKDMVKDSIAKLPVMDRVHLEYVLYLPSKRKTDINNVISVVDKYFQDALVELGKLPDDNYNHVPKTTSTYGGIDRDNPRVEVTIYPQP